MPLPLHIFEPRYREMIGLCAREERPFGVVLIKEGTEVGAAATPFEVGTKARIVGVDHLEDGRLNIVTVGTERFRLLGYSTEKRSYMVGDVEIVVDDPKTVSTTDQLSGEVAALAKRYVALAQTALEQDLIPLQLPSGPEELSYLVGAALRVRNEERQRLLELISTADRLELERQILTRETENLAALLEHRKKGALGPFSRN